MWFRQMESQFHLAGITLSSTKFHHILSCLPEHIACDLALDTAKEDYENLKKAIIENLSANKHELIEQALSTVPLRNKSPTQFINELKRNFSRKRHY